MPAISLVVCVCGERALLERLLHEADGCYDDLVVVHDGPENESSAANATIHTPVDYSTPNGDGELMEAYHTPASPPAAGSVFELVSAHHGRFFEGPRSFQQEPHWPFAWSQARFDWILRLDADEIPSQELNKWLRGFRQLQQVDADVSGFTCIWPLWDGRKIITKHWPADRLFLFDRRRVRFFGMAEQVPIPDGEAAPLPLILEHRPTRKSFGIRNLITRRQAFRWRRAIVRSLLQLPTDLAVWRWRDPLWPPVWEELRQRPLHTAIKRLIGWPIRTAGVMRQKEGRIIFSAAATSGIHHALIAFAFWRARRHPKSSLK